MKIFEMPETLQQVRQYVELADSVYCRGFSRETLLRCYMARYHATRKLMPWRDFLLLVRRGEFDYMWKDASGQSLS